MTRPTLTPALSGLLGGWLPRQRWFPVKSAAFSFEPAGGLSLAGGPGGAPAAAAGLEVLLLAVSYPTPDGSRTDVVQVPLSIRRAPLAGAESALIGQISGPGPAGAAGDDAASARRPVDLRRRPRPGVHRGVAGTDAPRRHHPVRERRRPPR